MHLGFPVLELRKVTVHYLKTWFVLDLVSSIPFSFFDQGTDGWDALRLVKVLRLLRIRRMMQRWSNLYASAKVMHVVQTVLGWLILAHWLACAWYALGWNLRCEGALNLPDEDGQTWVTVYWPAMDQPWRWMKRRCRA